MGGINKSSGLPLPPGPYCVTSDYGCEHLLIYRSDTHKPDFCLKYGTHIDRNDRQRAMRCDQCLKE